MKIIIGLFLLAIIAQSIDPVISKTTRKSSSGEHCQVVLSQSQLKYEASRRANIIEKLKNSFSIDAAHVLPKIVNGLGKQKEELQSFIKAAKGEIISYSGIYIFGLLVLFGLTGYWGYDFLGFNKKIQKRELGNATKPQLSIRSQIGIAGMILSFIFVIAMCFYGMDKTLIFQKGTNQIVCSIFQQPTGFKRMTESGSDFDLIDFVGELKQIEVVITQKYRLIKPLVTDKTLISMQNNLKKLLIGFQYSVQQNQQLKNKLNAVLQAVKQLNSGNIKQSIQTFNNTIQFAREVLMAYHIILNSLDIYMDRNIGVQSIGSSINVAYKLMYCLFLVVAVGSLAGMGWIIVKEDRKLLFFKDISLYMTGVCCLTAFVVAIINSILTPSIMWVSQLTTHLIQKQQTFKDELGNIKILNSMIADLIIKFSPFSDGDFTATDQGGLKKYSTELISALQVLNTPKLIQDISSQSQAFFNSNADSSFDQTQIINDLSSGFTTDLYQQMKNADRGAKKIFHQISQQGRIGKLDASAFGKYLLNIINLVYQPIFNGIYDQRWIIGLCAFSFLANLIFVYLIEITPPDYINISNKQEQKQYLSNSEEVVTAQRPQKAN